MLNLVLFASFMLLVRAGDLSERRTQCGENAAPSGLFVDKLGIPELICETPICFLSSVGDKDGSEDSVTCSNEFTATVCKGVNEWTGGLIDSNNGTHRVLRTECCEYGELTASKRPRKISLHAGESFRGGPVRSQRHITHFDVVKEVRKLVSSQNKVKYEITVQRMPCRGPEVNEKLSEPADEEYYDEYATDEKSSEYIPYSRRYRGGLRKPYVRERIRMQSYKNRELQRAPRRRMFGTRREQLFPLGDDYDFYESEFMPLYQKRSRHGKPVYVVHGRPRAYSAENNYDGTMETAEAISKETQLQSNSLPNIYNIAPITPPLSVTIAPTLIPPVNQQIPSGYPTAIENTHYQQAPSNVVPSSYNTPTGGCSGPCTSAGGTYPVAQQAAPNSYRAFGYNYNPSSYSGYSGAAAQPADLNGAFASLQCFSGEMTVQTPAGTKAIKELEVGDLVLSIQESLVSYSPIVMHLHKAEHEDAVFNRILTEDGYELELTDYHLIYSSECGEDSSRGIKLTQAYKVMEGHCVYIVTGGNSRLRASRVTNSTKVERKGIYAPLTATGDIIVNNVLASCHTNMAAQTLQQTFFSWWRALNRIFGKVSKRVEEYDVPLGVEYLTTVIDLLLPTSFFV
uniref:HintN domain-containing protein n=1 Tax=Steinernema glaseri TaxID=37863 RepID=A0A1I7ZKW2_9BILA